MVKSTNNCSSVENLRILPKYPESYISVFKHARNNVSICGVFRTPDFDYGISMKIEWFVIRDSGKIKDVGILTPCEIPEEIREEIQEFVSNRHLIPMGLWSKLNDHSGMEMTSFGDDFDPFLPGSSFMGGMILSQPK